MCTLPRLDLVFVVVASNPLKRLTTLLSRPNVDGHDHHQHLFIRSRRKSTRNWSRSDGKENANFVVGAEENDEYVDMGEEEDWTRENPAYRDEEDDEDGRNNTNASMDAKRTMEEQEWEYKVQEGAREGEEAQTVGEGKVESEQRRWFSRFENGYKEAKGRVGAERSGSCRRRCTFGGYFSRRGSSFDDDMLGDAGVKRR